MEKKIRNLIERAQVLKDESSFSSAEKDLETEAEAGAVFDALKIKLRNIDEWNDHGMLSTYALFDENGTALQDKVIAAGTFMRIHLKGSGKYDWVRVIDFFEHEGEFVMTVKPTFDPTAENVDRSVVSHFFTDESTNNFCVRKKSRTVSLYVIGLDEKLNTTETGGALQTARNVAVNFGSYLGIQNSEWEKFAAGMLECAAEQAVKK